MKLEEHIVRLGQDPMVRAVLRYLYEQHPTVIGFEQLKYILSLDEVFNEMTLRPLVATRILEMSDNGFQLTSAAFEVLQSRPELIS